MASKNNLVLLFCMFFVIGIIFVLNGKPAQAVFCGYTCGANPCQEVTGPSGCQATCPDPPDGCVVCTTSCQGNCVQQDPALIYNSACGGLFDWTKGDLNTVPPDVLVANMGLIGNRFSELNPDLQAAVIAEIEKQAGLPPGSIDISACTTQGSTPLFCGVTIDANGNIILTSGGVPLNVSDLTLSEGSSVEAVTGPPPGWQFNIPPGGEINYNGFTFSSTGQGTITWDGTKATLSQGTSLTYTDPVKGTITTVFAKQGSVDVYFGVDVPAGKTGVAINGPAANGDGVQIVGVIVAVAHTTPDGQTVGIITDRMAPTEEVLLKKEADQNGKVTYALDLTKAGYSNVKFTDGFEGLTYDAGTMYQCNQATGSCPYDTNTDITLLVTWYPTGQSGGQQMAITVGGQSGITGANIVVCPCDKTVPCDAGCVCDMICGLCDPIAKPTQSCLPEWLWITLGYENYLKCTKAPSAISCTSDSGCCQEYGAPYKPIAFMGRADICEVGKQFDTCNNLVICRAEDQRRCFNPNDCERQGRTYCEKSCGYCNMPPSGQLVELITNVSHPIENIHYADFINDEHPETATYEIVSQSNPTLTTCTVVGSLCKGKALISNLTIQCTTPQQLGNTTLEISIVDECSQSIGGQLTISVINATTNETSSQLGIYVNGKKLESSDKKDNGGDEWGEKNR